MGHDLDQVIAAAPGAIRALRQQRDAINDQIVSLEKLLKAHGALDLLYDVTEKGNVENVRPDDNGHAPHAHYTGETVLLGPAEPRGTRGRIIEALATFGEPMKVPDLCDITGLEVNRTRAMLQHLMKEEKVSRVRRGVYVLNEKEA